MKVNDVRYMILNGTVHDIVIKEMPGESRPGEVTSREIKFRNLTNGFTYFYPEQSLELSSYESEVEALEVLIERKLEEKALLDAEIDLLKEKYKSLKEIKGRD